jgi:hypothetical protein
VAGAKVRNVIGGGVGHGLRLNHFSLLGVVLCWRALNRTVEELLAALCAIMERAA